MITHKKGIMSAFDPRQTLIIVFTLLRQSGFELGVGELLAVIRVAEGDIDIKSEGQIQNAARLLWCKSPEERIQFEAIWASVVSASTLEKPKTSRLSQRPSPPKPEPIEDPSRSPTPLAQPQTFAQVASPEWTALPVYAPFTPTTLERKFELLTYWPVSRRSMAYAWRYLRRPITDGPEDVLDLETTVERVARQGFFLSPVYRRRERNHAHLMLIVDQGGSMVPLHRFSRDLIETAQYESTIEQVDVVYFHNIPGDYLYSDSHLTKPVPRDQVLVQCTSDTSVLIVSDAGAARGYRRLPRIQATTEALFHLKQHTALIAWLNPMPQERWSGASAQIIAHLIPMFQMDLDGFNNAIDVVRGQPFHHYQ